VKINISLVLLSGKHGSTVSQVVDMIRLGIESPTYQL